ncbi:PhoH family protein [Pelagicoccus sp. SDUM812002]|uniref:PhoH family protein n=1 Tax=Pelagicoccus sp. SDUM812002 TaxID=3041266 RepID=UPI00280F6276|nr:PhoH family protein [Pelagicoccus sp. SDUM812002]MDQ8188248.1 PhoH family protein [Pelagicoccus sp. SDUM812002]
MPSRKIHFQSPRQLSELYCSDEENLELLETTFQATVVSRDNWIQVDAESEDAITAIADVFELLLEGREQGLTVKNADFLKTVTGVREGRQDELRSLFERGTVIKTKRKSIVPKTLSQKQYLRSIFENDVVFGIGPAGTGKTYLAMAAAVSMLIEGKVERIILSRPAVEAGETLGFLPGDLQEKILPYLRPLYDALNDMLSPSDIEKLTERGIIEIAPLAYMRGRTLSNSFVVLDEAQNTTSEQMMMFLTRLGEGSRMVITGDLTQVDIPKHRTSGLLEVKNILKDLKGINFHFFEAGDVVRHHLVQKIIQAYDRYRDTHQ